MRIVWQGLSAEKCIATINSYLMGTNESLLTSPFEPGTGPDIGKRTSAIFFFHLRRVCNILHLCRLMINVCVDHVVLKQLLTAYIRIIGFIPYDLGLCCFLTLREELSVQNSLTRPVIHLGFMNVILLYGDHRHVSATRVAIFRVVSARIQIYL
jgi:hypothetical protein